MPAKQRLEQLINQLPADLADGLHLTPLHALLIRQVVGAAAALAKDVTDEQAEQAMHGVLAVAVRAAHHVVGDADQVLATVRATLDGPPVGPGTPPQLPPAGGA